MKTAIDIGLYGHTRGHREGLLVVCGERGIAWRDTLSLPGQDIIDIRQRLQASEGMHVAHSVAMDHDVDHLFDCGIEGRKRSRTFGIAPRRRQR